MTIYTEIVRKVKKMSQTEKIALLKVLADYLDQEAPKASLNIPY